MVVETPELASEGLEVKPLIKELVSRVEQVLGPEYEILYDERCGEEECECRLHFMRYGMPEGGIIWFEDLGREVVSELTYVETAYIPREKSEKIEEVVEEVNKRLRLVVEDE
jgi:hypothetical protein